MHGPHGRGGRLGRFLREFTAGVTTRDLKRLFDHDAAHAYRVLTRDQKETGESRGKLRGSLHRAKTVFLGLSFKLTPARRVLFGVAILAAVLGLFKFNAVIEGRNVEIDFSPLWFLVSIGLLVFLLALELVDRVLVRDELEVARQLQRDLLPTAAPDLPGYRIAHSYRTANEVGGDYYDFLPLADGRTAFVIGDASGHGMAAGLLMAIANAALKLAVEVDPAPVTVAELLNRVLCRTGDRHAFMTLFYGVLSPTTGRLDYVCAGHPFPLLRRADGGIVELGTGGLLLGIKRETAPEPAAVTLEPGDVLALFSDGLPEAVDPRGEALGYDALRSLLVVPGTPQEIHDRCITALDSHRGDEPLKDDLSIVVVARV
ncbi:MAG: PP2C family protein-serine/threonine phosphatase [Thermoanaerobaculales bacterium]